MALEVWRDAPETGVSCGLHKIERLMHANELRARPRHRGLPKDEDERPVVVVPSRPIPLQSSCAPQPAQTHDLWPAADLVDTEKRCLMKLEVSYGEARIQS